MSAHGILVTPHEYALIKVGVVLICLLHVCCYMLLYNSSLGLSVTFVLHVLMT